ncbi:hypothetical protein D4A39_16755 [Alcanivorax profundi]|uniref:Endonuclease/exonuclease/phosphatase domain-containing protein n=1 Tax=Alcanivorax profundi TaxID=2338368 RepID=A0A418XR04_9GAMM|nr:hypothetical protein D4A39_16755 [Alcanivorax profundi]
MLPGLGTGTVGLWLSSILYVIIYKPPQQYQGFIEDFTEMLSVVCTEFNCIIITGDLNVHVDNVCDRNAKELCAVLETFGLTQHVSEPTHSRGHTLDLLITKGVNISNVSLMLAYLIISVSSLTCLFHPHQLWVLRLCEGDT